MCEEFIIPTNIKDNKSINHEYIKNNNSKFKFYYMKKEFYKSLIIIYSNVQIDQDIDYKTQRLAEEIVFPRLIANPSKRMYVFLSSEFEPIYQLKIHNNENQIYYSVSGNSIKKSLAIEDSNMKDVCDIIKADYRHNFIVFLRYKLSVLPFDLVNIIMNYNNL